MNEDMKDTKDMINVNDIKVEYKARNTKFKSMFAALWLERSLLVV